MGKMKLYELAKELNLTSKELLKLAGEMGIELKSHLSSLEDDQVEKIKSSVSKSGSDKSSKKAEKMAQKDPNEKDNKKATKKAPKETLKEQKTNNTFKDQKDSPVIIRREVIIEENDKKEVVKKEEKKPEKNPFVQRNEKKDFNIVYRNRPEKPLTVSELFGLNKKKEEPEKIKEPDVSKSESAQIRSEETKKEEPKKENPVIERQTISQREQYGQNRENRNRDDRGFRDSRSNNFRNREGDRNNSFRNRDRESGNNYRDGERNNNFRDRNGDRNNNFRERDGRNSGFKNNGERNGSGFNKNNRFGGKRPLDEKGIEKNIKDIMGAETIEKESREYNKSIDKQKNNNKFDENRNNKKKSKRSHNDDINEGKLKNLKQHDRLSNMFEDTSENGMLEYYDLTTQRGRKGKKKNVKDENRNKQKIFKLEEITIPESISVKDLAQELKKTSGEVIMKLMSLGIMATLNNEVDFDTAFLVAEEFGVTAIKKEEIKEEDILFDDSEDNEEELAERPPVVVVMGHVDHGKT